MTTVLNGLIGGLLAGLVAAVAIRPVVPDPSVTAAVLERAVGRGSSTPRWAEFAVQLSYGGLAGCLLVALELSVLGVLAVPPSVAEAFGVAVAWSALLFGVLLALWRVGAAAPFTRPGLGELLAFHLVYGLALGLWIRTTWIT